MFVTAAQARAKVLGMVDHPVVVVPHPIASRTPAEMRSLAERLVDQIATGLARPS